MSVQLDFDTRFETQPERPTDRPPTRKEAWEYTKHWYGDLKDEDELKTHAKLLFVWNYVYYVNFRGWTNPPDWQEGEPIVEEARPRRPFLAGSNHDREVYRLLRLQKGKTP